MTLDSFQPGYQPGYQALNVPAVTVGGSGKRPQNQTRFAGQLTPDTSPFNPKRRKRKRDDGLDILLLI